MKFIFSFPSSTTPPLPFPPCLRKLVLVRRTRLLMSNLVRLLISLVSITTLVCLYRVVSNNESTRFFFWKKVIGYPYHNGDNQHWTFDWTGDSWTIRSVSSGQYLGVESTNYSDGDKLVTVSSPFNWDIWHDEANPNAFRWVFFFFALHTHECCFDGRL